MGMKEDDGLIELEKQKQLLEEQKIHLMMIMKETVQILKEMDGHNLSDFHMKDMVKRLADIKEDLSGTDKKLGAISREIERKKELGEIRKKLESVLEKIQRPGLKLVDYQKLKNEIDEISKEIEKL